MIPLPPPIDDEEEEETAAEEEEEKEEEAEALSKVDVELEMLLVRVVMAEGGGSFLVKMSKPSKRNT